MNKCEPLSEKEARCGQRGAWAFYFNSRKQTEASTKYHYQPTPRGVRLHNVEKINNFSHSGGNSVKHAPNSFDWSLQRLFLLGHRADFLTSDHLKWSTIDTCWYKHSRNNGDNAVHMSATWHWLEKSGDTHNTAFCAALFLHWNVFKLLHWVYQENIQINKSKMKSKNIKR